MFEGRRPRGRGKRRSTGVGQLGAKRREQRISRREDTIAWRTFFLLQQLPGMFLIIFILLVFILFVD